MRRRWFWLLFGAGALALLAFLGWLSRDLLDARAEARFQTSLRLALARMDQRFAFTLATEARRPLSDYEAVSTLVQKAYTRSLQEIEAGEIFTRSGLFEESPPYARIHFQVSAAGEFTSPQVPTGAARDFLVQDEARQRTIERNAALLAHVNSLVDPRAMLPRTASGAGTLEPLWHEGELLFVRRVTLDGEPGIQGFLADWPQIRKTLLAEIADLLPGADLRPPDPLDKGLNLITLPMKLFAPRTASVEIGWTSTHTFLATIWPLLLLAIALVGVALKKSLDFGERQRRFAGLVTHELRSPLTTFRLYSELLADGLVKDETKRAEYHRTLHRESDQMARMVENVIAHARLEEGRAALRPESVAIDALLDGLLPDLERITEKEGQSLTLGLGGAGGLKVRADTDAVRQILSNLVQNACKYGRSDRPIELNASASGSGVHIAVRDHGEGVPPALARRIFRPYERGNRDETDPTRGLGLGLALARGLARDLGGALTFEAPQDGGARFVLTLPRLPDPS